ncbi:DUF3742 family protein [Acidovorax sp. GBBC 1281]|uniref:DUF3742 family protein n=1 Tax=unclassified Acidovorax TaxID=2684926 RepID=UPI00234AB55B|nr:DUF3742 family protein [Acidovorax sp. GBBC 1281]WCM96134.1 DUF3742 family protein [Acidovorax sp. GBBC 1281]
MPNEQSAYRLGRGMSRVWSGWARAEKWLGYWLVSIINVSPITAKRLIWFMRVTLLVGLGYTSIWLALGFVAQIAMLMPVD